MDWSTVLTILVIFGCFLFWYVQKDNDYFKNLGVPYVPPVPFFGNMAENFFRRKHMNDIYREIYNYNKDAKYIGAFDFAKPVFVLRDPELIKSVTIKNFDCFEDRLDFLDASFDPLFGGNLFSLHGDKWREIRNLLTPAFTSSKIKGMYELMVHCAENFTSHLEDKARDPENVIDSKDLFTKYTNDVIATCAFGVSVDSLKNPSNEFYVLGRRGTSFDSLEMAMRFIMFRISPKLMKLFGFKFVADRVVRFFTNLVKTTIETREKNNITRPDMIQLMMDARGKTSENVKLDIMEMTAQAFVFLLGGFETTSTQMCIIAQELILNPDIQERLQKEIDEVMSRTNGKPTYDAINAMPYIDAVFNESLRRHPQIETLDRLCRKPFEIPPALPGLNQVTLKPGDRIQVPVPGLHLDEKYFKNPEKFDPDRYLNKKLVLNQAENFGFGIGPRACIGNRFATLETKILFFHVLAKFTLVPSKKTGSNFNYKKQSFSMVPEGGYWINVKHRK